MPRRNLVFFIFISACLYIMYFFMIGAPNKARLYITETLSGAGFPNSGIGDLQLSMGGIRAQNISLDQNGLDGISQVEVDIHWPVFLLSGRIKSLRIHGLQLTRNVKDIKNISTTFGEQFLLKSNQEFKLTSALIDLISPVGNIRIIVDASSDKFKNGTRKINARLSSNQFQMGFDSLWQGTITDKGQIDLFGEIFEGRINTKHMKVSRVSGWSSLSTTPDGISSQISLVAGRGLFQDLPLQSLSLKAQKLNGESGLTLRSGLSGFPDTLFTFDAANQDGSKYSSASLKGSHLGKILQSLSSKDKGGKDLPKKLEEIGAFSIIANLQPDLQFANGPSPYSLSIDIDGKKPMTGNVLFYADTMDVRGSIEIGESLLPEIKTYFDIPDENVQNGFIRLDQSIKE